MKTIDTHCHLEEEDFKIKDNFILISISTDEKSMKENNSIWLNYKNIFNTIGVHPCDVEYFDNHLDNSIEKYINESTVAIGEIGLDFFHKPYNEEKQKKYFLKQILIAIKFNLPIVVHTRDSLEETYQIIKMYPNIKFLLHSWSGNIEETKKFISLGQNIYFSFNGILTFKNAPLPKSTIKIIPLNRIMFETDSPYLTPEPNRGKKNSPYYVVHVIKYAANILKIDFKKLNNSNNQVAIDFFNLDKDIFNES